MANGWTPERRERQAAQIRHWKPWELSTGPRTEEGKNRASQNSYKGGKWLELRELKVTLNKLLREQRDRLHRTDGEQPWASNVARDADFPAIQEVDPLER